MRWFCRWHRDDRGAAARQRASEAAALGAEFRAIRDALGALPAEVVAQLHAAGLAGVNGRGAAPGTLWYWWALRRAYQRWLAERKPFI